MRFWIGSQGSGLGSSTPAVIRRFNDRLDLAFSKTECGEVDGVIVMFYLSSNFYDGMRPWRRTVRREHTVRDILGRKQEYFHRFVDVSVQVSDGEFLSRTQEEQYSFVGTCVASLLDHVFGRLNAGDREAARSLVLAVRDCPYEERAGVL